MLPDSKQKNLEHWLISCNNIIHPRQRYSVMIIDAGNEGNTKHDEKAEDDKYEEERQDSLHGEYKKGIFCRLGSFL